MHPKITELTEILSRTPVTLHGLLAGLSTTWTNQREDPSTWSAFDVVGHLIHGDRSDWIPRLRRILESGESIPFEPFDRFAQERSSAGKSMDQLLEEFAQVRVESLEALRGAGLTDADLERRGSHPVFGSVTVRQLLSAWTAHDLGHVAQISRAMASRYREEVGPWREYLPVLAPRRPD